MFKVEESFPNGDIFLETKFYTRDEAIAYMQQEYDINQENEDDAENAFVLYERGWIKSPVHMIFS